MTDLNEIFVQLPPFDAQQIMGIIPHRHPFLLIDEVSEFGERHVVGSKTLSISDPVFAGHFPGEPVYPGVLQIETIAQLGACWILARRENIGKIAYLMTVESAKFRRPAVPGMKLEVRGEITSYKTRMGRLQGEITCGGQTISSATVLFAFQRTGGNGRTGE